MENLQVGDELVIIDDSATIFDLGSVVTITNSDGIIVAENEDKGASVVLRHESMRAPFRIGSEVTVTEPAIEAHEGHVFRVRGYEIVRDTLHVNIGSQFTYPVENVVAHKAPEEDRLTLARRWANESGLTVQFEDFLKLHGVVQEEKTYKIRAEYSGPIRVKVNAVSDGEARVKAMEILNGAFMLDADRKIEDLKPGLSSDLRVVNFEVDGS